MRFHETPLAGCFVIEPELVEDERGFFGRTFCVEQFAAVGADPTVTQCSISFNRERGTLRGLHYQAEPHQEAKLVTCTRGHIFDVVVDLRPPSPTFAQWTAVELTADNYLGVYIPHGCAHGFMTVEPLSEVRYQISTSYRADAARGVRWNCPDLAIAWPRIDPLIISDRDRRLPSLSDLRDLDDQSAGISS